MDLTLTQKKEKTQYPIKTPKKLPLPTPNYLEDKKDIFLKEEKIFSQTFSNISLIKKRKRKKPQRWSEQDTTTFYKCLEFFGEDFQMIKGVLTHKTKRQLLRKFHKEKKKNLIKIQESLNKHENNLIEKNSLCNSFFNNVFQNTSGEEDLFSDGDDSLDEVVRKKLKLVEDYEKGFFFKKTEEEEYEKILPLEVYFDMFQV